MRKELNVRRIFFASLLLISCNNNKGNRPDAENYLVGERLIYTCNCGWIDLGHAQPDGALVLWNNLQDESIKSKDGKGFKVSYKQSMSYMNMIVGGRSGSFYVKTGLTESEKESVALAIFMEISYRFESYQNNFFWSTFSNSGFSSEDLVSDLIGFYSAVRPDEDYIKRACPVSTKTSLALWDKYGPVDERKNTSFRPVLYPCTECGNTVGPASAPLPEWLTQILPAQKGDLFRVWNEDD